jgi:hypothetical protein
MTVAIARSYHAVHGVIGRTQQRRGTAVRYLSMQVLTWGTVAGAVGSALLLAAVDGPMKAQPSALPGALAFVRQPEPAASGHPTKPDEDRSHPGGLALPQSRAPLGQ